ncbi:MAG: MurR/RpiR family transcriptional regulator [Candidatus Marinimicrobia bacterium]|nr:MurR/RpiR family transcriptional regulator [Candidatus Neomarinimicrobiota bacterium]
MVREKIRALHSELSPNQRILAEFILNHIEEIPFWNSQTLAKSAGTSPATVVRFSQRLGYSGYPDLREDIADLVKGELNREYVSRIESLEGDVLSMVASQDVTDINDTLNQLNRPDFYRSVDLILGANQIHTAGLGVSNLMADLMAYQLNQVGISAAPMRSGNTSFSEQVAFFQKDHVLVAFSYPPYSETTVEIAQLAKEKGVKVIGITNKLASPISFHADITLAVRSENILFTNAFAAISVIINALATECAHRDKGKAQKMLSYFQP